MSKKESPQPAEIKRARLECALSQTKAAKLIYSTYRTWQDWEAGKAHMHPGLWELFQLKKPEPVNLKKESSIFDWS